MKTGMIFDIQEFSIHDGPGIRLSVFLKGCPLCCSWCHNPEGISPEPQFVVGPNGGKRLSGIQYSSGELIDIILRQADILNFNSGGVTFTGGEPLMQADFLEESIAGLGGIHFVLDTSGYGKPEDFYKLAASVDLVFMGLKLADPVLHRRYTGKENDMIIKNLKTLKTLDVPFIARVPLIPGVTDTDENLTGLAGLLQDAHNLLEVNLLSYNKAAGGKYKACGIDFKPGFDESRPSNPKVSIFEDMGIKVSEL